MPTTLPRITVSLTRRDLGHLDEVARLMRKSRSATAAMIIEGAVPFLRKLHRAATSSGDPTAARAAVLNVMTSALADVSNDVTSLTSTISSADGTSESGESGDARGSGRAAPRAPRRTRRRAGPRA